MRCLFMHTLKTQNLDFERLFLPPSHSKGSEDLSRKIVNPRMVDPKTTAENAVPTNCFCFRYPLTALTALTHIHLSSFCLSLSEPL